MQTITTKTAVYDSLIYSYSQKLKSVYNLDSLKDLDLKYNEAVETKKALLSLYESLNLPIEEYQEGITAFKSLLREEYTINAIFNNPYYKRLSDFKRYIQNTEYDSTVTYEPPQTPYKLQYEKDTARYEYLNKKRHYTDTSVLHVLKVLYHTHKIHKHDYKDSKRRIHDNNPLKNGIKRLIHYYYMTLKAHNCKTSLSYLNRTNTAQREETAYNKGQRYKITVKKNYERLNALCSYYEANYLIRKMPITTAQLRQCLNVEFIQRLKNCNVIKSTIAIHA